MLTFDETTHTYRLNGVIIPSVTQLLRPLHKKIYTGIDNGILKRAAERGNVVHKTLEQIIKGEPVEMNIDNEYVFAYQNTVNSWVMENKQIIDMVVAVEERTWGVMNGQTYAGTIDLLGKDFIIDFKTRPYKHDLDPLQLYLYRHAVQNTHSNICPDIKGLYIVSILRHGTFFTRHVVITDAMVRQVNKLIEIFKQAHCAGKDGDNVHSI